MIVFQMNFVGLISMKNGVRGPWDIKATPSTSQTAERIN
jgi:hypothetical protein